LEEIDTESVVLARVRVALANILFATIAGPTIRTSANKGTNLIRF
jgi:hypothetical protein